MRPEALRARRAARATTFAAAVAASRDVVAARDRAAPATCFAASRQTAFACAHVLRLASAPPPPPHAASTSTDAHAAQCSRHRPNRLRGSGRRCAHRTRAGATPAVRAYPAGVRIATRAVVDDPGAGRSRSTRSSARPSTRYVNGSQTWFTGEDRTLEWRLHPVGRRSRCPRGSRTTTSGSTSSTSSRPAREPDALALGGETRRARRRSGTASSASPRTATTSSPRRSSRAPPTLLGLAPELCGLVDHDKVGDAWERRDGAVSIVAPARRPAPGLTLGPTADVRRATPRARVGCAAGRSRPGTVSPSIAAEREVDPPVLPGERLRQRVAREEPDLARLERVTAQLAADHPAVEHERVERHAGEAEPEAVEHAMSDTGSTSIPVSS